MATVKGGASKAVKVMSERGIVQQMIINMRPQFAAALPDVMSPERFIRLTLTAFSKTPKLYECTQGSLLGALLMAAQLGMEPNSPLGQAYLIPYYNRDKAAYECQFQLGYKGMINLAYRSGKVTDIAAYEVRANDRFDYELGLESKLYHKPALRDRGEVIAYYAVWHTKDGGHGFAVMSKEDVEEHRNQFSKASQKGFSPWSTAFDEMAKKTVLKKALKYAPMAADFQRAMMSDGSVKNIEDPKEIPGIDILDEPNEMDYVDTEAREHDEKSAAPEQKEPADFLQNETVKVEK
mgnify:CR=1 FL=1